MAGAVFGALPGVGPRSPAGVICVAGAVLAALQWVGCRFAGQARYLVLSKGLDDTQGSLGRRSPPDVVGHTRWGRLVAAPLPV